MEPMTHAPFIWAAYGIAAAVYLWLGITRWRRARRLEGEADRLKNEAPARRRRRNP